MGKFDYINNLPPGACYIPDFDPYVTEKRRYVRVEHDGAKYLCEPSEAGAIVQSIRIDEQDADIQLTDVWMTEAQFDRLPEFQGY